MNEFDQPVRQIFVSYTTPDQVVAPLSLGIRPGDLSIADTMASI